MNINQVLLFRIQKFGVVILNAKNMFFFKFFAPPKINMEPKKASDVKSGNQFINIHFSVQTPVMENPPILLGDTSSTGLELSIALQ